MCFYLYIYIILYNALYTTASIIDYNLMSYTFVNNIAGSKYKVKIMSRVIYVLIIVFKLIYYE